MGLDMYAFSVPAGVAGDQQTDIMRPVDEENPFVEIAYWRKFNHLHGWMEKLYHTKGGKKFFNCTTVRLDPPDLDVLSTALKDNTLEATAGFFFGGPEIEPGDIEDTQKFIDVAREEIKNGNVVLYDSWW